MKLIWGVVCVLAIVGVVLVFLFREVILLEAGRFMAAEANQIEGVADVVILEGTEFISRGMVSKGIELLSLGKTRRMIIVLHSIAPNDRPFALNDDYASSVKKELRSLGIQDSIFRIIVNHIHNPVTLVSASGTLEALSKDGVKSAVLVSSGFHMRRSFLVYQHLCLPLNIKIYPIACFDTYEPKHWWDQDDGPRDFLSELQKLMFYMVKGYIPLKLSY
jgi:hypothetical protein